MCLAFLPTGSSYNLNTGLGVVDVSFIGTAAQEEVGMSVAFLGDVNGDGYDDVGIGAPGNDTNGAHTGKVYIMFGGKDVWGFNEDINTANASFIGESSMDRLGRRVVGAGDVNGDGYDDILIGAPGYSKGFEDRGKIYLVYGRPDHWDVDMNITDVANASFLGIHINAEAGYGMCGGDYNNDGHSDLVFGLGRFSTVGVNKGRVYVFWGKSDDLGRNVSLTTADVHFTGEQDDSYLGNCVNNAGDLDGDGIDDLVIGSPGWSNTPTTYRGAAYAIFGKKGGWTTSGNIDFHADVAIYNRDQRDNFGQWVDGAGDVNKDGFDEILVGAFNYDDGDKTGLFAVYLGMVDWPSTALDNTHADMLVTGITTNTNLGVCVAGAGDVNGDGYGDFVVGANGENSDEGETHLMLGHGGSWSVSSNVDLVANASFVGEGPDNDQSGYNVDGGGDFNGDGYDDLIIGAQTHTDAYSNCGKTYIVYPETNQHHTDPTWLKLYPSSFYGTEATIVNTSDSIHVVVQTDGVGGNDILRDVFNVKVTSDNDPVGFILTLNETGNDTHKFIGTFSVENVTYKRHHEIGAPPGSTITVAAWHTPSVFSTVVVSASFDLEPSEQAHVILEDTDHFINFTCTPEPATWNVDHSDEWMVWDEPTRSLHLTPTNENVGETNFTVVVRNGPDVLVREYIVNVSNVAPEINGTPPSDIWAGEYFEYDLNSTDDGQGTITWDAQDIPPWLNLGPNNGTLYGRPNNGLEESYDMSITVHDGNHGYAVRSYKLNVSVQNHDPVITGLFANAIDQDRDYNITFGVSDPDAAETHTWTFFTTADWLFFNETTGALYGTPNNGDVGFWWVNLTVTDKRDASDNISFVVQVVNLNDDPYWTKQLESKTIALGDSISNNTLALDIDVWDAVTYAVSSIHTSNITIGKSTGTIDWTPPEAGVYVINVSANDGNVTIYYEFTITVFDPSQNSAPVLNNTPLLTAFMDVEWEWEMDVFDADGDDLDIKLITYQSGMILDERTITWTPYDSQKGMNTLNLSISDGFRTVWYEFQISVKDPSENDPPDVDAIEDQTVVAGETLKVQVEASDDDDLTYQITGISEVGFFIDRDGMITWNVPNTTAARRYTIRVDVNDGLTSTVITFNVTVLENTTGTDGGGTQDGGDGGGGTNDQLGLFWIIVLVILGAFILLIIMASIIAVVMRSRKKPEEEELPTIDKATHSSADAIVPEAESGDIFKERELAAAQAKPLLPSDGPAPIEPKVMGPEDMIEDEPPETIEPGLVGAEQSELQLEQWGTEGDEAPAQSIKPDLLALPPATIVSSAGSTSDYSLEEVLVISKEGLLMQHYARDESSEIDKDVLSGMLTAVQSFVADSFAKRNASLRRLEMAEFTILIEPGQYITVVGITRDRENREVADHLIRMKREVEEKMGDAFEDWEGDVDSIAGVEEFVEKLMNDEYSD